VDPPEGLTAPIHLIGMMRWVPWWIRLDDGRCSEFGTEEP
jgi:hypothetical protein